MSSTTRSIIGMQIDRLPEPFKSQANINISMQAKVQDAGRGVVTFNNMRGQQCTDIYDALDRAFGWKESNEGFDYWHKVEKQIKKGAIKLIDEKQ
jgi:hypothetical protein